jgi:maltose/maltodextrin transport system permease protein
MAIVQPKSVKYRVWATHLVMWGFLALIIFPLIMVIAISFRNGNFSVGEIIPSNPTRITGSWRSACPSPTPMAASRRPVPGADLAVELHQGGGHHRPDDSGALHHLCLCLRPPAVPWQAAPSCNGMLIFQMFPAVLALVAIYALFNKIGDYIPWLGLDTHGGLILAYMGGIAMHVWTIKGYFETILLPRGERQGHRWRDSTGRPSA